MPSTCFRDSSGSVIGRSRVITRFLFTLWMAPLVYAPSSALAATVTYQHPHLTIVADNEPLDVVLKSIGREMRVYVQIPAGRNPMVSCDIQRQGIAQAFRTLLPDASYTLEWDDTGDRLTGLVVFPDEENSSSRHLVGSQSGNASPTRPAAIGSKASVDVANAALEDVGKDASVDTQRAHEAHQARIEQETRILEEHAPREGLLAEEAAQQQAQLSALLESLGLQSLQ